MTAQRFPSNQVPALAQCLHGRVLEFGDDGYEQARIIHNSRYARYPALIVQAADVSDVITAVNFARDHDLTMAVHSGGHSLAGYGTSDEMVLDLSPMKGIDVDPNTGITRVEPGLTWAEVTEAIHAHGLAIPAGDTSSVGVGGLTTGGGIGWLVRKYGLTIDSLLAVDVVTADGRLLRADTNENPELFWAVRGGGGNFGVVTAFTFQAHPVGTIIGGAVIYDAAEGGEVLRRYAEYAASAPDELTTIVFLMHAPPAPFIPPPMVGKPVIIVGVCYTGDLEEGQRVVAPLRALGTPVVDITAPMPYPAIYALTHEATIKGRPSECRSMFMQQLDYEAIRTILQFATESTASFGISQLRVLGGAMARVPADATAFSHRDKQFMFTIVAEFVAPEAAEELDWIQRFWQGMRPHADGVYVNFLSDEGEQRIREEAYGPATYQRLATLKATYDPTNFFHLNQNIKPAIEQASETAA